MAGRCVCDAKDWTFMEKSDKVLKSMPETWKQYPDNLPGMMDVIETEFNELKYAVKSIRFYEIS